MKLPFELTRPLVFFDLETTGLNTSQDRIVELALIRITPHGDVLERVRRFNPGIPIPPDSTKIHGITDADVAEEPPFSATARSLVELLENCDLAGFNIKSFDIPMLLAEFKRAGVAFSLRGRRLIDAQAIFHREEPRDLSAAARFYLGREHREAHTALGDIRTTAAVLAAQMERYSNVPSDMDGLHTYCEEARPLRTELSRWFLEKEGEYIFRRGKYRGKALVAVVLEAPDYLQWMLGVDDMEEEVLAVVRQALGRGP